MWANKAMTYLQPIPPAALGWGHRCSLCLPPLRASKPRVHYTCAAPAQAAKGAVFAAQGTVTQLYREAPYAAQKLPGLRTWQFSHVRHRQLRKVRTAHVVTHSSSSSSPHTESVFAEATDSDEEHTDHEHDHGHSAPITDSKVHRVLEKLYSSLGVLQVADLVRERTWSSITIVIMLFTAMAINWLVSSQLLRAKLATTVSSAAIACIYLLAGIPSLVDLTFDLTAGQVDTHVLTTLAVFGTLAIGGAFEGALLLVLFQVSHTVEHELTHRAAGDLRSLFDSIPQHAVLVKLQADGAPDLSNTEQAKARDVAIGSLMLVKAGEQVALDGQIVYGEAMVSTEHITGEALPSRRRKGDEVPAGALNHDGVLVVRALRRSADSTPARIAKLTSDAQAMRPELRRWLDDFGEAYSKGVIAATLAALVILPLTGVPLVGSGAERGAMYRAMGLLTTASPCALVLVPLAYVSAIAAVTSRGMLIKGGRVLDALARCSTVAFDKTGTLTTGAMACTAMLAPDQALNTKVEPTAPGKWVPAVVQGANQDDKHALATAVALSLRSNHPASRATAACGKAASGALPNVNITDFKLVPGAGVQGFVERGGQRRFARFGSCEFAAEILPQQEADALAQAVDRVTQARIVSVLVEAPADAAQAATSSSASSSTSRADAESSSSNGRSSVGSGRQHLVRMFVFEDTVHERSAAAVQALLTGSWQHGTPQPASKQSAKDAIRVMMLTGDNASSAGRVSRHLGITEVHAGLTPKEKLQAVQGARTSGTHSARGNGVLMVGDGINDAPALAAADVGLAIASTPNEAAAAAADVIVLTDDGASAIPFLLAVADRTQRVIKQNLLLAVGSIIVLALPMVLGFVPLWLAVALHEGSTLLVALSSLRLLRWDRFAMAQKSASSKLVDNTGSAAHTPNSQAAASDVAQSALSAA